MESLADTLGLTTKMPDDGRPRLEDITDAKAFAQAVLTSPEFRTYIVSKLTLGELPPAVITRLMDYAWGKPAERVEHTGKDGQPIETITEVRRVIIRTGDLVMDEDVETTVHEQPKPNVH